MHLLGSQPLFRHVPRVKADDVMMGLAVILPLVLVPKPVQLRTLCIECERVAVEGVHEITIPQNHVSVLVTDGLTKLTHE